MARKPSPEDMCLAAEWLLEYEPAPDDEAGPAMRRVAEWLEAEAAAEELRQQAKAAGIPMAAVRRQMRKIERQKRQG